jgi:gamma-glutamylcyclotransferase (GGCT)/AIG2-like uncharacterized protein YtfP
LFAYGLLQPGLQPPKSVRRCWKDWVRGRLYDLGPFPGAMVFDSAEESFEGWVLDIDEAELPVLDEFEDVTGERRYRRVRTRTLGGVDVWIYDYIGPVPANARPLARWPAGDGTEAPLVDRETSEA